MSYDQSDCEIDRKTAEFIVSQHNVSLAEFVAEIGDKQHYSARQVLAWLGY